MKFIKMIIQRLSKKTEKENHKKEIIGQKNCDKNISEEYDSCDNSSLEEYNLWYENQYVFPKHIAEI